MSRHPVSLACTILAAGALLALAPLRASARVNLDNFGGGGFHGTILDGGFDDPTEPPGGGGGGAPGTVAELEDRGYVCTAGGVSDIECRSCGFEPVSETQSCSIHLCANSGTCNATKYRYHIPAEVETDDYGFWAKEFSWGASRYYLADFDFDGRDDLAAEQGSDLYVALSRGTHFEDIGKWTAGLPLEPFGAGDDVNGDGYADVLSVSSEGHLVVGISNGSGIIGTIDMPNVFCAGIGECLIGDVDGDDLPDLVEVMHGAIALDRAGDVWVSIGAPVPGFPERPEPPPAPDTDGDGVADRDDVCIEAADAEQLDSDGDGYGNACDADLDGDGVVGRDDLETWVFCFLAGLGKRPECAPSDFNGDGIILMEDYHAVFAPSEGGPPGPSAIDTEPEIELFTPVDGTILNVGTSQAWVAGWVANVPAGDVEVFVNDVPVQLVGADNYFSTFIALAVPPTEASLFRPVVVEALRGDALAVERRVVLQGDTVKPGFRAHGALGARMSAEGLGRIEEYLQNFVAQEIYETLPEDVNGYTYDFGCVDYLPICYDGYEISNATVTLPVITAAFEGDTIHVSIWIDHLGFDWEVSLEGPNCGEDTNVYGIALDMRYRIEVVQGGRIEVHDVYEPVINADFDIDGCWGGGHGKVKSAIIDGLRDGAGSAASAIEDVMRSLAVSGSLDLSYGAELPTEAEQTSFFGPHLGETEFTLVYDSRFESVSQTDAGIAVWLGAGVDVAEPVPGLGGPDGAYQIPFATTPPLPEKLPSNSPYHIAAAVTPNGINEALDALARSGFLQSQGFTMTEVDLGNGVPVPITAGLLRLLIPEFGAYPVTEAFRVAVNPSPLAPVVSGRRGPGGETLDVQLPQARIDFFDASGGLALGLHVDARVGVDVSLGTSGSGTLTATARKVELLDFALTANAIGADPAVVFQKLLCVDADPDQAFSCALSSVLADGVDKILASVAIPSLESETDTEEGFELVPQCLVRLTDGTLVAEFQLLIPGEEPISGSHHLDDVIANSACTPPLTVDPGGDGGGWGPIGGTVGTTTTGTVTTDLGTATTPPVVRSDLTTATTTFTQSR